ncbi:MAG TPA: zf-HC2 domain-containing protein, partial [Solirubrobacterales bacterium]|nr:zf-HC2 domain-containing protein [Solirubrobacterales bacterium]
ARARGPMSAQPMSCREALEFPAAYLDEELATDVREVFERHLARCAACPSYLESYRETIRLGQDAYTVDDTSGEEIPEELVDAILVCRRAP